MTGDISEVGIDASEPPLPRVLAGLEATLVEACAAQEEWPRQIAAGIYAGIDFVIRSPALLRTIMLDEIDESPFYERFVARLAKLIQLCAPIESRLPGSTDEALVASIVGLVGDHVRVGRLDRLAELCPELVLLTLLPYLGFADAQRWANQTAPPRDRS